MSPLSVEEKKALEDLAGQFKQKILLDIGRCLPPVPNDRGQVTDRVYDLWDGLKQRGYVSFDEISKWPDAKIEVSLTEAGFFALQTGKEVDEWLEIKTDTKMVSYENGEWVFHSKVIPTIFENMAAMLGALNTENFVTIDVQHAGHGEMYMTVGKSNGDTPGKQLGRQADEIKRLRGMLEAHDINPDGEFIGKNGLRVDAPASKADPGF